MAVPSKTLSCPLTDSHTEPMSNHRFQECHAISRLSVAPSAPAAHWEVHVLCPDKPLLPPCSPCLIIDGSIGWCETCLCCHHVCDTRKAQSPNWNTDPADRVPPRYSTRLKCRRWGAATVVGTLQLSWLFCVQLSNLSYFSNVEWLDWCKQRET